MSLAKQRANAEVAEGRVCLAQAKLSASTNLLRARMRSHGGLLSVAGGIAAGFVAGLVPVKSAARLVRAGAGAAGFLLRSPVAKLVLAVVAGRSSGSKPRPSD